MEKNLLINAAATPKEIAKTIENNPYKVGTSTDNYLINIDSRFKSFVSIFAISCAVCSAKKVS